MSKDRHQGLMDLLDEIAASTSDGQAADEEAAPQGRAWRPSPSLHPKVAERVAAAMGKRSRPTTS